MFVFPVSHKWKNSLVLILFFVAGNIAGNQIFNGAFVIVAMLLAPIIGKELEGDKTYFYEQELNYYDSNYYSSFYRLLLTASYIVIVFDHGRVISLDIAFFTIWLVGYTVLWYSQFFIPSDGKVPPEIIGFCKLAMVLCILVNLLFLSWILNSYKEFTLLSPIFTDMI